MAPADAMNVLRVVVAWTPSRGATVLRNCELPAGSRVADALAAAGAPDTAGGRVGIWGRLKPLDEPLRDGDRVEVYRSLTVDPKEARRQRYRSQRERRPSAR